MDKEWGNLGEKVSSVVAGGHARAVHSTATNAVDAAVNVEGTSVVPRVLSYQPIGVNCSTNFELQFAPMLNQISRR